LKAKTFARLLDGLFGEERVHKREKVEDKTEYQWHSNVDSACDAKAR